MKHNKRKGYNVYRLCIKIIFFFVNNIIRFILTLKTKRGARRPCVPRKTDVSWLCVLSYPHLYCVSSIYEWFLSWENFLSRSWVLPSKFQKLVILLVPKPSSSIENNPLQMWLEPDVSSSYIPLPSNVSFGLKINFEEWILPNFFRRIFGLWS